MSLNWDFTKCDLHTQETRNRWNQIVSYLVMFVGVGSITDKNIEEVYRRINLWETAGGALAGDIEGPVTLKTLRAFLGASWNVAPETKAQFEKRLKNYALDCLKRKTAKAGA